MSQPYRTLFVGTLVQDSFLSVGGTDDPCTTVDGPFCRDGLDRPTLRGTGLAGALVATLRRVKGKVPAAISCAADGRLPSVWRTFHSHPENAPVPAFRQHVAIDEKTGAAAEGALFNVETLPPETRWPFLLEVDTSRDPEAADLARATLAEWQAGRCWLGREVARGLGWMRLEKLAEYRLTGEHVGQWPQSGQAENYPGYIARTFARAKQSMPPASHEPPIGLLEITGRIVAGPRQPLEGMDEGYGLDSLSVGGHASDTLAAEWDACFLKPEGRNDPAKDFDPDLTVVMVQKGNRREAYVPGSSLRGPLRHALARLLSSRGQTALLVDRLFGSKDKESARLLIRDAFPKGPLTLAWFQQHAEDEFAGGAYGSAKFDRVALMAGSFEWKMVLEGTPEELREFHEEGLKPLMELAKAGQIGLGGGQWRGHGWLRWEFDEFDDHAKPWEAGR